MSPTADAGLLGLDGKVAMVVGGGQGLGEANALHLARAGCAVAVVDIEADRAERVAASVRELGRPATAIVADVLDPAAVGAAVDATERSLGGLDVVVAVVGASKFGGILELTVDEWDRDQARNLRYLFALTQASARSFVRRSVPGVIVATATAGVADSMPYRSSYGAAKAGVVHFVRSMAVELGEYGIRINAVAPGLTVTPRVAGKMSPDVVATEQARIPLGRIGTPDDVARVVVFLASDLARHVTGATLPVDGGSTAAPNHDLGPSRTASRRNRTALGLDS